MPGRVQVEIGSDFLLPSWAITHFLQQTEVNYLRYVTVDAICGYAADGFDLTRLAVAPESAELFPREKPTLHDASSGIVLASKAESPGRFWNIIRRHSRPMVYVRADSGAYAPLYDFFGDQALTIRRLEVKSPFEAVVEGLASALPTLLYASEHERREALGWENEQIGQAARNVGDIVRTSQTIEDPRTPEGVRIYAKTVMDQLMEAQQRLNKSAGVSVHRIDEIG